MVDGVKESLKRKLRELGYCMIDLQNEKVQLSL